MGERQLPGNAANNVPGGGQRDINHRECSNVHVVIRQAEGQQANGRRPPHNHGERRMAVRRARSRQARD